MSLGKNRKRLSFEERDKHFAFRLAKAKALWRLRKLGYSDAPLHEKGYVLSCMGYPYKWITYILGIHPNDERKVLKWDTTGRNTTRPAVRITPPRLSRQEERKLMQQIK